jgi:hypothetical protein
VEVENSPGTSLEQRQAQLAYITHRWRQLYELEKEASQTALQNLFLANAGGAAATLAFIGASKAGSGAKWALGSFGLGLILLGFGYAKQFHHMSGLFEHWKSLVGEHYSGKKSYDQIVSEDTKKAVRDLWDYFFPYTSFGCFIVGSIVGFWSLMCA